MITFLRCGSFVAITCETTLRGVAKGEVVEDVGVAVVVIDVEETPIYYALSSVH